MMVDLLDIAPATSVGAVKIGDHDVTVRALNANDIATIVARYPKVLPAMIVAYNNGDGIALFSSAGVAVGAIIAAGCDHLGDETAERFANSFIVEEQVQLFNAIMGLTFPNGLISFMEAMGGLMTGGKADEPQKSRRVRLKTSPSASPPSSDADSRPNMQ